MNLASVHHQWFTRALSEPKLNALPPAEEEWVAMQQFEKFSWPNLVDLWLLLNRLLIHVLAAFPDAKVNMPCRIGIAEPISFLRMVDRYLNEFEDVTGQILSLL